MKKLTPTGADLDAVREDMICLRESGCRILVPVHNYGNLLVARLSDDLVIAPSEEFRLGFSFSESPNPSRKLLIKSEPYQHCPSLEIHLDHKGYFVLTTHEQINAKESIVRGQDMYVIPLKWMLNTGAVLESK